MEEARFEFGYCRMGGIQIGVEFFNGMKVNFYGWLLIKLKRVIIIVFVNFYIRDLGIK